jgi:hypothetical protein
VLWTCSIFPLFALKRVGDTVLPPSRCANDRGLTPGILAPADRGTRWRCRRSGLSVPLPGADREPLRPTLKSRCSSTDISLRVPLGQPARYREADCKNEDAEDNHREYGRGEILHSRNPELHRKRRQHAGGKTAR